MGAKVTGLHISQGGVPKDSVDYIEVKFDGCLGDRQNDLKHHGGENKAICLFQQEIIQQLNESGHPIYPGSTGENILVSGIKIGSLHPGSIIKFANVELEITQDASPCKTISSSFIGGQFNLISNKLYPNFTRWYAKVNREGSISLGESLSIIN